MTTEMPVWLPTTARCVRSRRRISSIWAFWAEAIRPSFGEQRSRATGEGSAGSGEEGGDITDFKVGSVGMDEEAILHKAALLAAEAGFQPNRGGDGKAPCHVVPCD